MANRLNAVDLDLNFSANPITGDVSKLTGKDAIKRSLKNLIFLNTYEKPFHPEISGNIRSILFELDGPFLEMDVKENITRVVERYEPRVNVKDVRVKSSRDQNSIEITLYYSIGIGDIVEQLTTTLERIR